MSLLKEIQDAAVDSNADLGSLLRRCKVLAARLKSKPLEDWLIWESNGYPAAVDVPKYRVWALDLKGNFAGPFGSGIRMAPIPAALVPENVRDRFTMHRCRMSVAAIEELLRSDDKGVFAVTTGDLSLLLGSKVYVEMECIEAWGQMGSGRLIEVLNTVRNRILDFVLALEQEDPQAGDDVLAATPVPPARIQQIFMTTVQGNVGVVGAVHDSTLQMDFRAGDLDGLAKYLRSQDVPAADVKELRAALAEDPPPKDAGAFGPRVSGWMGKMVGKAAGGAWKVGTDVAATVLTKAICAYYGIG